MAIEWGPGEGSGNAFYVGIDVSSLSSTSATVKLYAKSTYNVADNQTMAWSNAASGSQAFYHEQSGGTAILVKTLTITGTAGTSKTITASLSGVYNGGTPSHSRTFTFPAPTVVAPNAPASMTATYVSDTTTDLAWPSSVAANKPVDRYRVERYDYANPGAGYVFQNNYTGLSARLTNGAANTRYSFRVRAENTAGVSGWVYAAEVYTNPAAPTGVTLTREATGELKAVWTDRSPQNTHWEYAFREDAGTWPAATSAPNSTTQATKASPNTLVSHQFRIRATTSTGRASSWVESNTLSLLSPPNPPTALSGGVADPARPITNTWQHNTTDGSGQLAYQLRWKETGAGAFTEGAQVASSAQQATWPGGTFTWDGTPGDGLEVEVRTKGQHATWSGWSATSAWTWATTPEVDFALPGATWGSPVLVPTWTTSQPQALWQLTLADAAGNPLEVLSGSGAALEARPAYRLTSGLEYNLTLSVRSTAGLWSEPAAVTFTTDFPLPAPVTPVVVWDPARGWAVVSFTVPAYGPELAAPNEVDLYRSDTGPDGTWYLVAEGVPVASTVTDTEPAVDGRAVWVARSRNTTLATEADGPLATTEVTAERGYLSGGDGFEVVVALVYAPETTLKGTRPGRQVITLDGGNRPRRVLVETPEVARVLSYAGRLYGPLERDTFEALAIMNGPHLYRDPDGRKVYGALDAGDVARGARAIWWTVPFTITEADQDATIGAVVPA